MDLFKPLVKERQLHPLFRKIVREEPYRPAMDIINGWSQGILGRKSEAVKFVKEFQTTFNSSLWELYLNRAFSILGFQIDYSKPSPDFHLIHRSGRRLNVEAVTANNKNNQSDEYYSHESLKESINFTNKELLDQSTIKLIGKIKDKNDLFIGKKTKKHPYCSLEHVKENPFVIAVAPFDNHMSFAQNNMAINRVLYGVEPPGANGIQENIDYIVKPNGQRVNVGIFTNHSYENISAVMFSTTAMFGKALVGTRFKGMVRATRYRQMSVDTFLKTEGRSMLGSRHIKLESDHDIFALRFLDGNKVCGSDMHLYSSSKHFESHLDGLHIYFNPYAKIPLNTDLLSSPEVTMNSYDPTTGQMVCRHNDGSLVSRQTFTSL